MDMELQADYLKQLFAKSQRLLVAIGDETRQSIIIALANPNCEGMRVGEIKEKTHLSRPAVSHHLKILLDQEVVRLNRVGAKNFSTLKLGGEWQSLVKLINNIEKIRELEEKSHE
jgi:ArsR family transcriptional regulator